MLTTNVWKPDTCGCEITYAFDSDEPAETRVHTYLTGKPCKDHADVKTDIGVKHGANELVEHGSNHHMLKVLEENQRKNRVWGHAVEHIPELTVETVGDNGETQKVFKHHRFTWTFDKDRNLHWVVDAGTAKDQAKLKKVVDGALGKRAVASTPETIEAVKAARR